MLSAARSLIFNAMLAGRVRAGTWNTLSAGDVANLDGRGSVFAVAAVDEELRKRCELLDLHPTAPLLGEGESLATGAVLAFEQEVAGQYPEALAVIRAARMNAERRALRIRVRELSYAQESDVLKMEFALGSGSFATTVLREIIAGAATGE
jgi:tRNA pseudouridine13 synthase